MTKLKVQRIDWCDCSTCKKGEYRKLTALVAIFLIVLIVGPFLAQR